MNLGIFISSLIAVFFFSFNARAVDLRQKVELKIKNSSTSQPQIIYGHPEIGYFKAASVKSLSAEKIEIKIIPPTYKLPVSFFVLKDADKKVILSKKFIKPENHPEDLVVQLRGHFSVPFFSTGLIDSSTSPSSFYPAILNMLGEVVWYDKSHAASRDLTSSTNVSVLPWKGDLFIRGAGKNSSWNIVRWDGSATPLTSMALDGKALAANHSMGASPTEIYSWAAEVRKLSPQKDTIPVFSGLWGWLRSFGEADRLVVGNKLIAMNPVTGATRKILSIFDIADPTTSPSRCSDEGADRFLDAQTLEDYRNLKKINADAEIYIPENYDTDWSHENAIDIGPEGQILITSRHLNAVTLLTPDGKIIWSVGNEKFSTHKWDASQNPLALPHSARFITQDKFVVFDNAAPFRGMQRLAPLSRVLWVTVLPNGKIQVDKELELPGDKSLSKGSVHKLDSSNVLIWHSGPNTAAGQLIESNTQAQVVAHLSIQWPWYKKHDEALPIYSMGDAFIPGKVEDGQLIKLESNYDKEVY